MKRLVGRPFDQWRDRSARIIQQYGNVGDETCGSFNMPIGNISVFIIASSGEGWDHVSVSTTTRCPTWDEMSAVKHAFFARNEWAYELHPPQSEHLSLHPYCLHLWRCQYQEVPLPPSIMVAPPSARKVFAYPHQVTADERDALLDDWLSHLFFSDAPIWLEQVAMSQAAIMEGWH